MARNDQADRTASQQSGQSLAVVVSLPKTHHIGGLWNNKSTKFFRSPNFPLFACVAAGYETMAVEWRPTRHRITSVQNREFRSAPFHASLRASRVIGFVTIRKP